MPEAPSSRRFVSSMEVARRAGVSQSTVSRTFSAGAGVSPRAREAVLAAASALGYLPNHLPGIILSGRSHLVGMVVGGLDNPYYAAVLDRFAVALRENGQQVILVRTDTGLDLDDALRQLSAYRVDAVLTAIPVRSLDAAQALSAMRIPVVCFNAAPTAENVFTVRSDNRAAGAQAAQVLFERGARRFAFIGAPSPHAAAQQRGAGFRAALASLGVAPPQEATGDDDYESGFAAGAALFADPRSRPDGLFCSNDLMACGALDAMRDLYGLHAPADAKIIGYDNIPQADWRAYGLSSFDQQPDLMIQAALFLLAQALAVGDGLGEAARSRTVPARLVERVSTGST